MRVFVTYLTAAMLAVIMSVSVFAGIDTSTAWWNNETFESYDAGDIISDWDISGTLGLKIMTTSSGNKVLAGTNNSGIKFDGESNISSGASASKTYTNAYTGMVYVKVDLGSWSRRLVFSLRNSDGNAVFTAQTPDSNADNFYVLGTSYSNLGGRKRFFTLEGVFDVTNKKLVKVVVTSVSDTTQTFTLTDLDLLDGTDVKTVVVAAGNSGNTNIGLDNLTIGQLIIDKLGEIIGDDELQTYSSEAATMNVSTQTLSVISETFGDVDIDAVNTDITWSIIDYNGLSAEAVSVTGSLTDLREATLNIAAGAVSVDTDIVLQAKLGNGDEALTVTKTFTLLAADVSVLKAQLLQEIADAILVKDDENLDSNPYITGLQTTLGGIITTAQNVYDNTASSEVLISQTILDLIQAKADFASDLVPYDAFVSYISTAAVDAEERSGGFITAISDALTTAIANAKNAKNTVADTNEIAVAKTTLETALADFNAGLDAYDDLATLIATAETQITMATARIGADFLQYSQITIDAYTTAKNDAADVLNRTVVDTNFIIDATATLSGVIEGFKTVQRGAPAEGKYYKIYTYGVSGGGKEKGNKQILYSDTYNKLRRLALSGGELFSDETYNDDIYKWKISEISAGIYTIKNVADGYYFQSSTTNLGSATDFFYLLDNQNIDENGTVDYVDAGYFLYGIASTDQSASILRTASSTNGFDITKANSGLQARYSYSFQFEPVDMVTGNSFTIRNIQKEKVYIANNKLIIDGIAAGEAYAIYNITGTLAETGTASTSQIEISLPTSGVYIVKTVNSVTKVVK